MNIIFAEQHLHVALSENNKRTFFSNLARQFSTFNIKVNQSWHTHIVHYKSQVLYVVQIKGTIEHVTSNSVHV